MGPPSPGAPPSGTTGNSKNASPGEPGTGTPFASVTVAEGPASSTQLEASAPSSDGCSRDIVAFDAQNKLVAQLLRNAEEPLLPGGVFPSLIGLTDIA